ncbi:MAG: endolytic transglycosylase MltG, partial [Actinobacteria bacterium]
RHSAPPAPRAARAPRIRAPRPARRRGALRGILAIGALSVGLALVAAAIIGYATFVRPTSAVPAGKPVAVEIPMGSTVAQIGSMLASEGVVPNAAMFRLRARYTDGTSNWLAGKYDLVTGMTYEEAFAALADGPDLVYADVAIPEGYTARQIAARFADEAGLPEDELLALMTHGAPEFAVDHPYLADAYDGSLEGYLFPATYRIEEGATPDQVVEQMLDEFDKRTAGLDWSYAKSKNLTFGEVVVIASILEREAQLSAEFPKVASVIYNRLGKPMKLQLCATVQYTMDQPKENLSIEDTKRESPYNTYLHDGLPPGPISNPGMKALSAAAHPPKTGYLYYVLTGADGSQTFTETYDEFLAAKAAAKR